MNALYNEDENSDEENIDDEDNDFEDDEDEDDDEIKSHKDIYEDDDINDI